MNRIIIIGLLIIAIFTTGVDEADVYLEQQHLLAEAITAEGIAEANGIQEMNNALAGSGGEAIVKLRIAEALGGNALFYCRFLKGA